MSDGYFLRSARLGFRHWRADDLELALALWADGDVTRLVGGPFTPEVVHGRLGTEMGNQEARGYQYWPMFRREDGTAIGCCGLRPFPEDDAALETGFYLLPHAWGQGLGGEASRAVAMHAFERFPITRLVAGHHPENEASRRILTSLGFRYIYDVHYPPTGLMHPFYELPRDAFKATPMRAP